MLRGYPFLVRPDGSGFPEREVGVGYDNKYPEFNHILTLRLRPLGHWTDIVGLECVRICPIV